MRRQTQKSGDNSHQIQVHGDLHQGLTLEEARVVADLVARQVVAEHFQRADEIGFERMEQLNNRIIDKLDRLDRLDAFGDPAFRVSFVRAQIGAASSERESDYDLLASLLEDRALRGEQRKVRAGLNRAIEVVDQLDDTALAGLTVLVAAMTYSPTSGSLDEGLDALESLFAQFPMDQLPEEADWLDHLDVLGAVRVSNLTGVTPYEQMLARQVPGYVSIGVEAESEQLESAMRELVDRGIGLQPVPHELKPGYVRLPWASEKMLERTFSGIQGYEAQREATLEIAREKFNLDKPDGTLYSALGERLDARPNLETLRHWWNGISTGLSLTPVGRLLARANADRLDTNKILPPLDE